MPSLIDLRRRIRAVKSTQQITKAMKMIAASRLKRAQERVVSARPFAQRMLRVLNSLVSRVEQDAHPLLRLPEPGGRALLIVITADRGLCGSFNSNVLKAAGQFIITEGKDHQVALGLIGRKGRDFFRKRGAKMTGEHVGILGNPRFEEAATIARKAIERFREGEIDAVYVLNNEFKSMVAQRLAESKLLPVEIPAHTEPMDYIFEQPPDEMLESMLPRFVETELYRSMLETSAAEHAARMMAMEAATSNANDMINTLTLYMNRVRQAAITKEIIEVVSGAAAASE